MNVAHFLVLSLPFFSTGTQSDLRALAFNHPAWDLVSFLLQLGLHRASTNSSVSISYSLETSQLGVTCFLDTNTSSIVLLDDFQPSGSSLKYSRFLDLPATFTLLLNFGMTSYYHFLISLQNIVGNDNCRDGYIWDPFAEVCRKIYCSTDFSMDFYECVPHDPADCAELDVPYYWSSESLEITLFAEVAATDINEFDLALIQLEFGPALCSFTDISCSRLSNVTVEYGDNFSNQTTADNATSIAIVFTLSEASSTSTYGEPSVNYVVATLTKAIAANQLLAYLAGFQILFVGIHEQTTDNSVETFSDWCRSGFQRTYHHDQFSLVPFNHTVNSTVNFWLYINTTNTWYEPGEFIGNLLFRGSYETTQASMSGYVVVCENRSTILDATCPVIYLNGSDFTHAQNGTLFYKGQLPFIHPILQHGQYELILGGAVAVCIDLDYHSNFPLLLIIESYLSIVLTSISQVAMFATILSYLLFKELRNLPGLAILNLTVSITVFQITFMLGMRGSVHADPSLCIAVAILVHYEGLSAFLWTNVMAWDLFNTFGRQFQPTRNASKTLLHYALYAYGVPALIVAVAVGIHYCNCTGSFSIGYGKLTCWINNPLASLLFFGMPLALALMVNVALFLATVANIHRVSGSVKSSQRHSRKRRAHYEIRLYGRMCTVMGFTWIFGLVASLFDVVSIPGLVFTYIYVILNALEGLFIFVAFTCNPRVASLYKKMFQKMTSKFQKKTLPSPTISTISLQSKG